MGGKLDKDWAKFRLQWGDVVEKRQERWTAIAQVEFMGDFPRHFAAEDEVLGSCLQPVLKRVGRRDMVEGGINLHGFEIPGIEFQPMALAEVFGVKMPSPIFAAPRTGANDRRSRFGLAVRIWFRLGFSIGFLKF